MVSRVFKEGAKCPTKGAILLLRMAWADRSGPRRCQEIMSCQTTSPQLPRVSTMSPNSPQTEGRDGAHSSLTASIDDLNLAEQNSSVKPAKAVFGSAGVLLAAIRVYKLPPHCNDALVHVHLGLGGRRTRLRQAWEVLRPRVSSSRPGVE